MKKIQPTEILVYYDGVEVFAAQDPIGGNYIGMFVDSDGEFDRYLVTGVTTSRLQMFRSGIVDLKTLFLEAPEDEWFFTSIDGEPGHSMTLVLQTENIVATDYLPEDGFVLHDVPVDDLALQQARERGNVVFEFSAEPPETVKGHRIRMTTLAGLLNLLQTLVKHSYRNAIRDLPSDVKKHVDAQDGHLMDVVQTMPGSYRVVLEAARSPDLFGSGELVRALNRFDEVFVSTENPDTAELLLQDHRGHLAGAYVRLMRFLSERDTGFRYGWADPRFTGGRSGGVTANVARQLATSLSDVTSLTTEKVVVEGEFVRVNLPGGEWGLINDEGRKTGKIREGGANLNGLVTGGRYRFECTEDVEVDAAGREKHTLYAERIDPA